MSKHGRLFSLQQSHPKVHNTRFGRSKCRLSVFVPIVRHGVVLATLLAVLVAAPRMAPGQDDWFERMAVPVMPGPDFISMRDESLKGVGFYQMTELMLGPWYMVGPFGRDGSSSVPLRNVDITARIPAKAGPLPWKAVSGWDDARTPLDLAPLFATKENASAYLFRSIQSPGRASVELLISADDDFTVWLNSKEIIGRTTDGGDVVYGKHRKQIWLERGENELVIRVGQAGGAWQLFCDMVPQIDPRVHARILHEALQVFPDFPESYTGRVELAGLLESLGLQNRALEQTHIVLASPTVPPAERARADEIVRRVLELTLTTEQDWNLFTPEDLADKKLPIRLSLTNHMATTQTGEITLSVRDAWGNVVAKIPSVKYRLASEKSLRRPIAFEPPGWGTYMIAAETTLGKVPIRREAFVGLIPKPHGGLRPESFFAATTEGEERIPVYAKIGLKVARGFYCNPGWVLKEAPQKAGDPMNLDFTRLDKVVAEHKKHGLSLLPIVGYAKPLESSLARRLGTSGPPRDYREFTSITVAIVKRYPDIKYWEFWNEPKIYGPTWSASAASFRYFLKMWARSAKQARPDVKILTGSRPSFFVDNILPDPNVVKVMDGMTNHPRHDLRAPNWRSGTQLRSIDFSVQQAKRNKIGNEGMPLAFVTDSGTERSRGQSGLTEDRRTDAAKLVKLYVMSALSGCFQASVRENSGWGAEFPLGNVAHAVMAHLLEDRPVAADVWPAHPLIWGAVFAHPRLVSDEVKALPRASDIGVRWNVAVPKERGNDATKVAVVWSQTGPNAVNLDTGGKLTIRPAGDLRALDMMGRPVGQKTSDSLAVPFNQYPVYLLSDKLSVVEMQKRIARGRIEGVTPVNSYLLSLPAPLGDKPTTLTARVQNQLNRPLEGTISIAGPKAWKIEPAKKPLNLKPAELGEVNFLVTATSTTALNQYVVQTTIESNGGKTVRREIASVACIKPMTASVDGQLKEWNDAVFTRMDTVQLDAPEQYMEWLADPSKPRPVLPPGRADIGVKMAAAYDEKYVYVAAMVREPGQGNSTRGQPNSHDDNPMLNGDCFELAFGFGERAGDDYRKPDDPWYWKGMVRDVDYSIIQFRQVADQPLLYSLAVPGLTWRTDFQTERVNTFPVPGARTRFVRDEPARTTMYEFAVPRRYLNRFDPSKPYVRLGFVYFNDEKQAPLEWSKAAGVFDYWTGFGSYLPAWDAFQACQTRWGILR